MLRQDTAACDCALDWKSPDAAPRRPPGQSFCSRISPDGCDRPGLPLRINLRQLEAFRAVVTTGTATAAARALNVTQPAISQLINQFEESVGVELFHRHKGRLQPTAEAMMLYEEVDLAFDNLDRLVSLAANMGALNVGQLRIVAPPSLAEGLLSRVVAGYLIEHPNVKMSIDSRSPEAAKEALAVNGYDCGIGKLPVDHPGLVVEPLLTTETVCAFPAGHALQALPAVTPEDLAKAPLILLGQGRSARIRIEQAFAAAGVKPRVRLETHTVGAACACAASGLGVAVVNGMMASQYAHHGLVLRLFKPSILHEFVFMTPNQAPRRRLIKDFLESLRAHLRAMDNPYVHVVD